MRCTFEKNGKASLKIFGIGGAGGYFANRLQENLQTEAVDDIYFVDTDTRALDRYPATRRIQIGKGDGPLAFETDHAMPESPPFDPARLVIEQRSRIECMLDGATHALLIACLGGQAGTYLTAPLATIARRKGLHTAILASTPFPFEGISPMVESSIPLITRQAHTSYIVSHAAIADSLGNQVSMGEVLCAADLLILTTLHQYRLAIGVSGGGSH